MTAAPYDLVIGLDRADKKADLCLIDTATGQRRCVTIDTAPEAPCDWLAQLRQQHPDARVGLNRKAKLDQASTPCTGLASSTPVRR
jgi:hypothetical protein